MVIWQTCFIVLHSHEVRTLQCVQTPTVNSDLYMIPPVNLMNLPNWDKYRFIKLSNTFWFSMTSLWQDYFLYLTIYTFKTFSFKCTSKCIWACQPSSMQEAISLTHTTDMNSLKILVTLEREGYLFQKQYI